MKARCLIDLIVNILLAMIGVFVWIGIGLSAALVAVLWVGAIVNKLKGR